MKMLKFIHRYDITVENEFVNNYDKRNIINECLFKNPYNRERLKQLFGEYYNFFNKSIYTSKKVFNKQTFAYRFSSLGFVLDLEVSIELAVATVDLIDPDANDHIYCYLINYLFHLLEFQQVDHEKFDSKKDVMDMSVILPGYSTSFIQSEKDMLNLFSVDINNKIISQTNALSFIDKQPKKEDVRDETLISVELVGKTVVTMNTKRFYRIDQVNFESGPDDCILMSEGSISFLEYYQKRFEIPIQQTNQPFLIYIDKFKDKEDNKTHLIPELCFMTELTDEQRNNKELMTNLDKETKPNVNERLKKCKELVSKIKTNEQAKRFIKEWSLSIEEDPFKVNAFNFIPGNKIFKYNENTAKWSINSDKESQSSIYFNKECSNLAIFFPSESQKNFDIFSKKLIAILSQNKIEIENYKSVPIDDFENIDKIKQIVSDHINIANLCRIWILPDILKTSPVYSTIKSILNESIPGAFQNILEESILTENNLTGVISKMLSQFEITSGAVPWIIDDLYFSKDSTMLIGMYTCNKTVKKKVYTLVSLIVTCSTSQRTYFSKVLVVKKSTEVLYFFMDSIQKAIVEFKKKNSTNLSHIIVFRRGVTKDQRKDILNTECRELDDICVSANPELKSLSYAYVLVDETQSLKFFHDDINEQGSFQKQEDLVESIYIHEDICENDIEFYLTSRKSFEGILKPTHYYILKENLSNSEIKQSHKVRDQIAILCFQLSLLCRDSSSPVQIDKPLNSSNLFVEFINKVEKPSKGIAFDDFMSDSELSVLNYDR